MLLIMSYGVDAQQSAMITGKVTDEKGQEVELVNVSISGYPGVQLPQQMAVTAYRFQLPGRSESFSHLSALKRIPRMLKLMPVKN